MIQNSSWVSEGQFGIIKNQSASLNIEVYNEEWVKRHAKDSSTKRKSEYLVKIIKGLEGNSVLDIGCGSGYLVGMLSKQGYLAMGLDMVPTNIKYAKHHFKGCFMIGGVSTLIKFNLKFDIIVLSHILEHFDNPVEYLQSINPLLRDNGSLVVSVPNKQSYDNQSIWRASRICVICNPNHQVAFTSLSLQGVLLAGGYIPSNIETHTFRGEIINGLVIGIGRKLITGKKSNPNDKSLVGKKTSSIIVKLCELIPSDKLDRISEKNMRGSDLIIVANKKW